jgi:GNAT superfamily N-acetyltransferase
MLLRFEAHELDPNCAATREFSKWLFEEVQNEKMPGMDEAVEDLTARGENEFRHMLDVRTNTIIAIGRQSSKGGTPGLAIVEELFVCDGFRKMGVGSAMLGCLEQEAVDLGATVVSLYAWPHPEDTRGFYTRLGYEQSKEDEFTLVKQLPSSRS